MKNKRLLIKISILVVILLGVLLALSGCIRGMTPIGWSGVAVANGTGYTGSKEGRLGSGNLVFLAGYNGKVYAYAADTLQQRWVYPPEGNLRPIISSVVISASTLYF